MYAKSLKFGGVLAIFLGAGIYGLYPLHLFFGLKPLGQAGSAAYYLGATFGAAAIAWGMIMQRTTDIAIARRDVATASALGFLLLSLMRVLTLPFHDDVLAFLPGRALRIAVGIGESVLFGGLALVIWKGR